jgi:hypothetical protein
VILRFLTLLAAQGFDFATFNAMVAHHGPEAEANPLVVGMYLGLGIHAVALAKIALVALIGALGLASWIRGGRGAWAVIGGLPLAMAIAAGLIGGITNTAVILH